MFSKIVTEALPALTAMRRSTIDGLSDHVAGVSVSSAVVYFPPDYPLQRAVQRAQQAVRHAKAAGRQRLSVVHLNGGGERASAIMPWEIGSENAGDMLGRLAGRGIGGRHLSADLLGDLHHLRSNRRVLVDELERRVARRSSLSAVEAGEITATVLSLACAPLSDDAAAAAQTIAVLQLVGELEEIECR